MKNTITINCSKEDIMNLRNYMEYLKDLLATTDVSDDFAADENDYVTAYDLLTDNAAYHALMEVLEA